MQHVSSGKLWMEIYSKERRKKVQLIRTEIPLPSMSHILRGPVVCPQYFMGVKELGHVGASWRTTIDNFHCLECLATGKSNEIIDS